jgi:hypothetical protein
VRICEGRECTLHYHHLLLLLLLLLLSLPASLPLPPPSLTGSEGAWMRTSQARSSRSLTPQV